MSYKIEWVGDQRTDLEDALRAEIKAFSGGDDPESLISHTMMINGFDDLSGPSVSCHWDFEKECVVAEYTAVSEWIKISDL